jgi:hypothetical protein
MVVIDGQDQGPGDRDPGPDLFSELWRPGLVVPRRPQSRVWGDTGPKTGPWR